MVLLIFLKKKQKPVLFPFIIDQFLSVLFLVCPWISCVFDKSHLCHSFLHIEILKYVRYLLQPIMSVGQTVVLISLIVLKRVFYLLHPSCPCIISNLSWTQASVLPSFPIWAVHLILVPVLFKSTFIQWCTELCSIKRNPFLSFFLSYV